MTTLVIEERILKSRDRVRAYGEVFTPRHMVDQMLDLVSDDLEDGPDFVDKTFLEPAAGDGNFLVAILHRKLRAIERRLSSDVWADESLFALASIYGIELLEDNHEEARVAMLDEFVDFHRQHNTSFSPDSDVMRAARFIVDTNIVRGNTLTGRDWRGDEIQFSWWTRVAHSPGTVQREPFSLASLRESNGFDFTVYETYAVCRIARVHEEVRAGA
ncbi:MAG: methylase [Actinobacteria bacterium]|nr:methylase [Actinomycetota bacterium]